MRRRRVPIARLDDLTYGQMVHLAHRGRLTWEEINEETNRRYFEATGGIDVYGHLRPGASSDAPGRAPGLDSRPPSPRRGR